MSETKPRIPFVPQDAAGPITRLLPAWEAIPDEYKTQDPRHPWIEKAHRLLRHRSYHVSVTVHRGINIRVAWPHLVALSHSGFPSAHKVAAIAYLMDLWFDDLSLD